MYSTIFFYLFFIFFLSFFLVYNGEIEFYNNFSSVFIWDDYYEALANSILNDLTGFFFSFYEFNSFEFLVIGFFLLIGSMVCINLNKYLNNIKNDKYVDFLKLFNIFSDSVNILFLRKQNLIFQENQKYVQFF